MSGSDSDFRADRRAELVHEKMEKYLRAMPGFLKDPNGSAKLALEQALKELVWACGSSAPYAGLHEELLAKDEGSWLFYLSLVNQYGFSGFQEAKRLSPFCNRALYVRGNAIVLDPAQLDGVSIL